MTHQNDSDLLNSILQQLNDSGLDALLGGFATLLNEAMLRQRSEALGAQPYERCDSRKGHANGFKPKTVDTRMGPLELAIPQVRGDLQFYPSALDKGWRSEQVLNLALAQMYVQGVSTRGRRLPPPKRTVAGNSRWLPRSPPLSPPLFPGLPDG